MLSARQIKAARAMLDWEMIDLAREAGVNRQTIGRIEAGNNTGHEETIAAIFRAFDLRGIEFIEDEGVKLRKSSTRTFNGKAGYRQFLDHVYQEMKTNGGRIRQFSASDGVYLNYAGDFLKTHLERMSKIPNLDARVLQMENDSNFPATYCTYRWFEKSNRNSIPYYVYNDYVAMPLLSTTNDIEAISIHSKLLSQRFVEQFDAFWDVALVPGQKKETK